MEYTFFESIIVYYFLTFYRNLIINDIKRSERKGTEIVTDGKYALLFYTTTIYKGYAINVSSSMVYRYLGPV